MTTEERVSYRDKLADLKALQQVIDDLADRPDTLIAAAKKWNIPWQLLQIAAEAAYGVPLEDADDFKGLCDALASVHITTLYALAQRQVQPRSATDLAEIKKRIAETVEAAEPFDDLLTEAFMAAVQPVIDRWEQYASNAMAETEEQRQRAERAESAIERAQEALTNALLEWQPEHPYRLHRAKRGDSHNEMAVGVLGEAIKVASGVLDALGQPPAETGAKGCCTECGGSGYSGDEAVPGGACWDCQGTGHPHEGACVPAGDSEKEDPNGQ